MAASGISNVVAAREGWGGKDGRIELPASYRTVASRIPNPAYQPAIDHMMVGVTTGALVLGGIFGLVGAASGWSAALDGSSMLTRLGWAVGIGGIATAVGAFIGAGVGGQVMRGNLDDIDEIIDGPLQGPDTLVHKMLRHEGAADWLVADVRRLGDERFIAYDGDNAITVNDKGTAPIFKSRELALQYATEVVTRGERVGENVAIVRKADRTFAVVDVYSSDADEVAPAGAPYNLQIEPEYAGRAYTRHEALEAIVTTRGVTLLGDA